MIYGVDCNFKGDLIVSTSLEQFNSVDKYSRKDITFYIIQFYSRIHGWENPSEMAGFPGAWNIRKHKLRYIWNRTFLPSQLGSLPFRMSP
jgi:hypothetical protein